VTLSHRRYTYLKVAPMITWDSDPPSKNRIQIEYTDFFDARGMRRVYGRGDHFGRKAAFNMDIWLDRKGALFARFWSRSKEVDNLSIAIYGILPDAIPTRSKRAAFSDAWLPKSLRDEYDKWITSEL
jgi:hypothetical protein